MLSGPVGKRRELKSISNESDLESTEKIPISGKNVTEEEKIAQLLQFTNSIRVQMIPGSQENLDKKKFTWRLEQIDEY